MRFLRWLKDNSLLLFAVLVLIFLVAPIVVIAVMSFNDPVGKFNYSWQGFTLSYWKDAFALPQINESLFLSFRLAFFTALGATTLGTLLAIALVRHKFFGRSAANVLIVVPLATPEVVIGAALLSMFLIYGLALGFTTLLIAHIMFSISFSVVVVRSRLIGFDRNLEDAAADLGSNPISTFFRVTFPLILPAVLGSFFLTFVLSLDDFVISNFNAGPETTFPLYIYGASLRGIPVQVNVITTLLFLLAVVAVAIVILQQRRAEKMVEKRADDDKKASVAIPI